MWYQGLQTDTAVETEDFLDKVFVPVALLAADQMDEAERRDKVGGQSY